MVIEVNPRNTVQGRPRTSGSRVCARCYRAAAKYRIRWPEGPICGICFHNAMRTHGNCAHCDTDRLLPGIDELSASPICAPCAGIPSIICASCGSEAEHYRRDHCARCCLRSDLQALLLDQANEPDAMRRLLDVLAAAERPESVLTWMRPQEVRDLLRQLATGTIPLSHEGLDAEPRSNRIEHMRSILEAHELLPQRDHHLALFERWLTAKLGAVDDPKIRQPAEQFARWHHLARIRRASRPGTGSRGPVHGAKQEITETIRFLIWLRDTHHRYLQDCSQLDVESYVADGPSTRMNLRTFLVWCNQTGTKTGLTLPHRQARRQPRLTQQERLNWIRELLTGDSESLPYRITGTLLLLYAQPITRLVTLRTDDLSITPDGPSLTFGTDPVPIPEPFAQMLISHVQDRPNQRGANHASPWLFPSTRAGRHLHPNTVHMRLRALGISNLAARNRAIQDLVMEIPAPIVADLLGYSDAVTNKHAQAIAAPHAQYIGVSREPE